VTDDHGIGKQNGVGNYDPLAVRGADFGGARLNILYLTLKPGDRNPIADFKGLLDQEQDSGQKILQNILECEADRHAAYSEHADEVDSVKGGRHGGKRDQKANDDHRHVRELAEQNSHAEPTAAALGEAPNRGFGRGSNKQKHDENYERQDNIGNERDRNVDDSAAALPRGGKIDRHASRQANDRDESRLHDITGANCSGAPRGVKGSFADVDGVLNLFSGLVGSLLRGANPFLAGRGGSVQAFLHAVGDVSAQFLSGFGREENADGGADGDSECEE
jgi:hypothetical protein